MAHWVHSGGAVLAAFLASLVEFVEALTIVLAVGVSRGWRISLLGAGAGIIALAALVLAFGPLLTTQLFPLRWLQLFIGVLLLIFSARWLRKAILRAAGIIPLHDEVAIFTGQVLQFKESPKTSDKLAFLTSFKAVLIEGIEVVFIVITVGAAQASLVPASIGATAALVLVVFLGFILHKPLSRIPENSLKYGVAIILMAFGFYWIGEGLGMKWPGGDLAIPALMAVIFILSLVGIRLIRKRFHRFS